MTNRKIKSALKLLAIGAALLAAVGAVALATLYQRPSVRFLLNQTGLRQPDQCVRKEVFITVEDEDTSVMVYRHRSIKSDRYYYFQHGHAKEVNRHPALDRLAHSLCDATGMNVLIPAYNPRRSGSLEYYQHRIAAVYQALTREFPGHYRAFGACIGANVLLSALRSVPSERYPEKMLLTSPAYNGKALFRAYRKLLSADPGHNFIFKLATTMDPAVFDQRDKEALQNALKLPANKPSEAAPLKRVSGNKLFEEMLVLEAQGEALRRIDPEMMFSPAADRPDCTYFILHSKQDDIVPYYQGVKLAKYMQQTGMDTSFLGTELMSHTRNQVTVNGFVREVEQLVRFFDRLFEGDVSDL